MPPGSLDKVALEKGIISDNNYAADTAEAEIEKSEREEKEECRKVQKSNYWSIYQKTLIQIKINQPGRLR